MANQSIIQSVNTKIDLTIAIPTRNRPKQIESLLAFLYNEIEQLSLKERIEVLIGDNGDGTFCVQDVCTNSQLSRLTDFKYIKNEKDLGLVGNLLNLQQKAHGSYIWFLGDDDLYHTGILRQIVTAINEDKYTYIFLNHRAYAVHENDGTGHKSAVCLKKPFVYANGIEMASNIWKYSRTTLMFISANIYRTDLAKSCAECVSTPDLAYPLYMSFYCASKGKTKIIPEIFIDNVWGTTSWSDKSEDVFKRQVPNILKNIIQLGYSPWLLKQYMLRLTRKHTKRRRKAHFLMKVVRLFHRF